MQPITHCPTFSRYIPRKLSKQPQSYINTCYAVNMFTERLFFSVRAKLTLDALQAFIVQTVLQLPVNRYEI